MDNESYWAKRAEDREKQWNKKSKDTIEKELANYYEQALLRIEDDIAVLYGKYGKDNNLTYIEASKMLTSSEFKQWRMSMEDYLKAIVDSKDNKLLLELNTLAMRRRISRLDKLYSDTLKKLYELGVNTQTGITEFLTGAYKDNYYENMFDIGKTIGIKSSLIEVDNKKISKVLNSSWSGKNYSERIWKNTDNLAKLIKHEITDGFHRGVSIQKMSNLVQKRMNVGKYEATRLVRTEMNYVQNQASLDSIKEAELKYFIFLATLDKKTSTKCREHDRKVYHIDEAQAGRNMPPLHPHCRSTIAGNLTDYDTGKGKRTAKDDKGNRIIIPAKMNYDDYYKVYVEKSLSYDSWLQNYQVSIIGKEFSKQLEKLTPAEKEAITKYTGFGAEKINSAIIGKRKLNDSIKDEIRLLDSALAKGIIPEDIIVIRKTIPEYMNLFSKGEKIIPEKMVFNSIFTSTAMKEFNYSGRNVVIRLKVPKGYKGALYIRDIAVDRYKNQYEVLFHRGMRYIIKTVDYDNGIYYITAEVINNAR